MSKLCIFNPEHDICLANGNRNFVPPQMALRFARNAYWVMRILYGDEVVAVSSEDAPNAINLQVEEIIPWGWDLALRQFLIRKGIPQELVPTEEEIAVIRTLQHRTTGMDIHKQLLETMGCEGLASAAEFAISVEDALRLLKAEGSVIFKAPLSGSGQGLRPVRDQLTHHDEGWIRNLCNSQGGVMVERRYQVVQDFALEYIMSDSLQFEGYSWFETQGGAYTANLLIGDEEIRRRLASYIDLAFFDAVRSALESILEETIKGRYKGPLGVDMFVYRDGDGFGLNPLVEINFRHTMGLVAHRLLQRQPWREGEKFSVHPI